MDSMGNRVKITSYSEFLSRINETKNITEISFRFSDDPWRTRYLIICHRMMHPPIVVTRGFSRRRHRFFTAEELGEARIFKGKSLKEKWDKVIFVPLP